MAIEKREVNGHIVGFDTRTNSYCNLPADFLENHDGGDNLEELLRELSFKTADELADYAGANGINIGQASSVNGILGKIREHYGG